MYLETPFGSWAVMLVETIATNNADRRRMSFRLGIGSSLTASILPLFTAVSMTSTDLTSATGLGGRMLQLSSIKRDRHANTVIRPGYFSPHDGGVSTSQHVRNGHDSKFLRISLLLVAARKATKEEES
jgi:hypothetical protein